MKGRILFVLFFAASSLSGHDIRLRAVDEQAKPVVGAAATIAFIAFVQGAGQTHEGTTDTNGEFSANGRAEHSVFLSAKKPGHYEARVERLPVDRSLDVPVVLPRVVNPVPLYANRFNPGSGRGLSFPVQNEWLGYDFEVGDWVQPHGAGRVTDIRFKFRKSFMGFADNVRNLDEAKRSSQRGYAARREEWTEEKFRLDAGKWDAELEIAFPGEKEGLFEETRFLSYSRLKMPHSAPLEGYVPTWRYTANSYSPRTAREHVGFFLRTRVKLDSNGRILTANYAKVMGDFQLDPRGRLMFAYYFNPVSNERNLEFDPSRNLFPPDFPGSNVSDP